MHSTRRVQDGCGYRVDPPQDPDDAFPVLTPTSEHASQAAHRRAQPDRAPGPARAARPRPLRAAPPAPRPAPATTTARLRLPRQVRHQLLPHGPGRPRCPPPTPPPTCPPGPQPPRPPPPRPGSTAPAPTDCAPPPPEPAAATRTRRIGTGSLLVTSPSLTPRVPPPFPAALLRARRRGHGGYTGRATATSRLVEQRHHLHRRPQTATGPSSSGGSSHTDTAWNSRSVPSRSHTHGDGSPADTTYHPDHDCPPLVRRPSSKRSRNDGPVGPRTGICGQHARETRRCGQPCGTPRFRTTLDSGKSYFPHILLRRGHSREQLTRAGNPTRPDRPLESWGTTRSTTATTTIGPATSATRFRRTRPTALCA